MNFIAKPSLQHFAAVRIVSALRLQDDINYVIKDRIYDHRIHPKMRSEIEEKILEKITKLQLPKRIKQNIFDVSKPMLDEMLYWIVQHNKLPKSIWKRYDLCWTSEGTVDYLKTAEVLCRDEQLDITTRYELACIYCLEKDIPKLWKKLPEVEKEYLFEQRDYDHKSFDFSIPWRLRIQDAYIHNKITPELYIWQSAFKNDKNGAARKYASLAPAVIEKFLVIAGEKESCSLLHKGMAKTLFFLLAQVSEERQMAIIQEFPYSFLRSHLHWPRQHLFLETAERMWEFLTLRTYQNLNLDIIEKASTYNDYDYKKLSRKFWLISPITYKKCSLKSCEFLMYNLLKRKDKKYIKLILKDAIPEEDKITFCHKNQFLLNLIENGEWNTLKFLFHHGKVLGT